MASYDVPQGMAMPRRASAVVACHDPRRWRSLCATVDSLRRQAGAEAEVIIAVDNCPDLYERLLRQGLSDQLVHNEGRRGASATRNVGAEVATTPVVVFLDDDVRADERWLRTMLSAFVDENVAGVGGLVVAAWQVRRPDWFPEEFAWVVGASFAGMPSATAVVRNVWAENMAIRRDVFARIGGFRTAFGKVGTVSQPEDTDLCIRATAAFPDMRWLYEPKAIVHHEVPAERASFRFFLGRCRNEGRGKAQLARLLRNHRTTDGKLTDETKYVTSVVPRSAARYVRNSIQERSNLLRLGALTMGISSAALGYAEGLLFNELDPLDLAGEPLQMQCT